MIKTKSDLEKFISENWNKVNEFLDHYQRDLPVPVYTSVDIRESTDKFAPVDNNLYPAGFNNLCLLDLLESSPAFGKYIKNCYSDQAIKRIGIIPESNTKNTFYLDHLAYLGKALRDAGFEIIFLTPDAKLFENESSLSLVSQEGFDVKIHRASVQENLLMYEDDGKLQKVDIAILNNDQSDPLDLDFKSLQTPVLPSPKLGWFRRQKVEHFCLYQEVVADFAKEFDICPNLLQARFKNLSGVDYATKEGIESLAHEVDDLLGELKEGSKVFLKASQGTYGMGISVVKSGEEVLSMNRKTRNKMDIGKNKIKFTTVLVQEGVETVLQYENSPAEVTIYLVGGVPVGGFMRANKLKDSNSNLNAKGMVFHKFCISEIRQDKDHQRKEAVYSTIARLSTIASAKEIHKILSE